ncbi:STAS domain-containing protein [Streptomyces sp. NPDC088725]|uniref:STAS domain-containing protein n=1 Tax=Streptomyces sp. NPDC088725 TaxID=3365873 RepID=UPI0037FBFBDB
MADASYPREGVCVVAARGDLDIDSLAPLRETLEAAAAAHRVLVLDITDVTFGDSSFLNLLLRTGEATSLRIAAPSEQLQRLFAVTGADQVLSLYPSVERAVAG